MILKDLINELENLTLDEQIANFIDLRFDKDNSIIELYIDFRRKREPTLRFIHSKLPVFHKLLTSIVELIGSELSFIAIGIYPKSNAIHLLFSFNGSNVHAAIMYEEGRLRKVAFYDNCKFNGEYFENCNDVQEDLVNKVLDLISSLFSYSP